MGVSRTKSEEINVIATLLERYDFMQKSIAALEKRLDTADTERRADVRELREEIAHIREMLAKGSERMKALKEEAEHVAHSCSNDGNALEKRSDEPEPSFMKRPWVWAASLIVATMLGAFGTRLASFIFNGGFSDKAIERAQGGDDGRK